jgi:hypothetical protein
MVAGHGRFIHLVVNVEGIVIAASSNPTTGAPHGRAGSEKRRKMTLEPMRRNGALSNGLQDHPASPRRAWARIHIR